MQSDRTGDEEKTPRPSKRRRGLDSALGLSAPASPVQSDSVPTSSSGLESHCSGRLSPVKQLQVLEDFDEQPVVICNFDDDVGGEEPEDVTTMRTAIQRFADGIGILGYDDDAFSALIGSHDLSSQSDKTRLQYPWANDPQYRSVYGSMPSIDEVEGIVKKARKEDRGGGAPEDDWNTKVHLPLLELALQTSTCKKTLDIYNV